MGFFSGFKKAFTKGSIGAVLGFAVGGPVGSLVGGAAGGLSGYSQDVAEKNQRAMMDAQLASAQKIADAQNPANVVSATIPTASAEEAKNKEQTQAAEDKRRYSFNKTIYKSRSGKLGSSSNSAGVKNTLG